MTLASLRTFCSPARHLAALLACAGVLACGRSSADVLERIDGGPPGSNLRVDVFLLRSVSSCAVGPACAAADPEECFYVVDLAGARVTFDRSAVQFVPPGDPATLGGQQVQCFRLVLDDGDVALAGELTRALRSRVFQSSSGDINLEIRMHEIPAIEAGFFHYSEGIFLEPSALADVGLSLVNRETDFVYAITGPNDPSGSSPRIEVCAGTNWLANGVLGGSPYSWVAMSDICARESMFLRIWMLQLYFGLRDVVASPDLYGGSYPPCGQGDPDATRWFPHPDDCTRDPDFMGCGTASCSDRVAFYTHILASHWRRGVPYNGNHCSDGRRDQNETGLDTGGVCDQIGR